MTEWIWLARWLHIVGATVLFGTGLGIAFFFWAAWRSGDVRQIAHVARLTVRADWTFTLPSGVLQPLTGFWLIALTGRDPLETWLIATNVAYVVALGCWLPVVAIQIRIRDLAEADLASNAPLPETPHRLFRAWFALDWPAFLGLLGVFALMIVRPV